jgi:hypothetical protein
MRMLQNNSTETILKAWCLRKPHHGLKITPQTRYRLELTSAVSGEIRIDKRSRILFVLSSLALRIPNDDPKSLHVNKSM